MTTTFPQELQAARIRLVKDRPYLASAAWALQPAEKPGLGTMAVDQWWRLYYDPAVATRWTVEELAGVLYHEIAHLMRDHACRLKDFDPRLANICADAEINDDLFAEKVKLPDGVITPASIGQPDGLFAEEYYAALEPSPLIAWQSSGEEESADSPSPGNVGTPSSGEGGQGCDEDIPAADIQKQGSASQQDASERGEADGRSNGSAQGTPEAGDQTPTPSPKADGGSQADDGQPGDQGDSSGSKAGDSGGSKPGDEGKGESGDSAASSPGSSPSGWPSDSSARPGYSSQPPASPGSGHGSGQDGRKPGDGAQTPAPGAGRCGSCATGQPEPWEDGPPGEGTSHGVSRAEGELIRRDVARQIKEHSQSQGDVPGHWKRWAEEKLRPKVDWRRELAAAVRHAVADVSGASDYSYRRPSRRQGQAGNGKVVLPAMRHPIPSVAVVVDTSGSISDAMLAQALAEVSGILKGLGQREGVTVLAVDAAVQASKKVFRPEQVQIAGGGGTDMGVGLSAASKLRPVPQVAVVITDGWTPWPASAPRGMKVVVALSGDGQSPDWAKTVKIEERRWRR